MPPQQPPPSPFLDTPTPLVSAIIPSYNKAAYLAESVGSVLAQTYQNIEIVIVNDGSPDNTSEVAAQLQRDNPGKRFLLLEKPNGGISDARNFAIERCTGSIVCCLDGDDIAAPTFIEKGVAAMRHSGANLVCCNVEIFGEKVSEWIPEAYDEYYIRFNNCIPTLVLYHKRLWAEAGGYSVAFPFNEDWEFFLRLTKCGLSVHKLEEKLFRYRATGSGLALTYIDDSWNQSVSLMITSNDDLYCIEQVLAAHNHLYKMRANWAERFQKQVALHSQEWLLPFWLALFHEGQGELQTARELYVRANQLHGGQSWQALYRLAALSEQSHPIDAAHLYHVVRTRRPDMEGVVKGKIAAASAGIHKS